MRYSKTPLPTPFTFEKLPCPSRYSAVLTLAAAVASSSSNHRRNGERPDGSRYSATRISDIGMVTYRLLLVKLLIGGERPPFPPSSNTGGKYLSACLVHRFASS